MVTDLVQELRGPPHALALVAGDNALRTKTRFAAAIRAARPGRATDEVADLTRTESFVLTAIAYLQRKRSLRPTVLVRVVVQTLDRPCEKSA